MKNNSKLTFVLVVAIISFLFTYGFACFLVGRYGREGLWFAFFVSDFYFGLAIVALLLKRAAYVTKRACIIMAVISSLLIVIVWIIVLANLKYSNVDWWFLGIMTFLSFAMTGAYIWAAVDAEWKT